MAVIFIEGFDKYGPTGPGASSGSVATPAAYNMLIQGEWQTFNTSSTHYGIVAGLSTNGYALQLGGTSVQATVTKTFPASYSRLIGGFRFQSDLQGIVGVAFGDSGSTQSSIGVTTTGTIRLYNGLFSATVVATSTTIVTTNSIHYLEWDITFGASASYNVYLDGVSVFSGSTGNTKTTTNSNANQLSLVTNGSAPAGLLTADDLYLFDPNTGSTNTTVLNSNPRIETKFPSGDSQTQWTNAGNVIIPVGVAQTGVSVLTSGVSNPGVALAAMKITPAVSCTLQSVAFVTNSSNGSVKYKAVLYSDNSGSPNSLLATGTETIGPIGGTVFTLPFASGQSLTGGTSYWIGFITDTSLNLWQYDNSTARSVTKANTYASGPPNPAGTVSTGGASWLIWGNATGATTNYESIAANPPNGAGGPAADNSSITATSTSTEDLYSFPALTTSASSVYVVAVKTHAKMNGSGAHTLDCRVKSNLTDNGGSNTGQAIPSSYTWLDSYFETDPNGGGAWTYSAVNAITAGPKVAS